MRRRYTLPPWGQIQWLPLLLGALALLWGALAASPANAQTPPAAGSDSPQLGFHVGQADGLHLAAARAAGGRFVVVVFNWANIEPEPGYLYWEQPDAAVRAADFYNLELVARLDQPPAWARQPGQPLPFDRAAYAAMARRVAERYGRQLAGLILWNEPNLSLEWNGQPPDAAAYVQLIEAAYPAVKAAAPELPVALAGLASTEGEGDWAANDLDYLQGIYQAGGAAYFDVLTAHPYGFGRLPDDPPGKYHPNFRRLELYREIMAAHGDEAKPVWVTEAGWLVRTDNPKHEWRLVTPQQQAGYLRQALDYAQSHYPWLERLGLWQLNRQGDPYGYDLWSGPEQASPAYQALVANCASRSPTCGPAAVGPEGAGNAPGQTVTILAPDVAIRLGDRETLQPGWVHLHRNQSGSSLSWEGEFYMTPAQAADSYDLLLETMLVGQGSDRLRLNGQDLAYLRPRSRPDATSTWVTQRWTVPPGLLQPGANQVSLAAGPRNPARQYVGSRWENFQFRHVRLEPARPQPAPLLAGWQRQPSPSGWSETNRLRPGLAGDLWLTGSRPGELWHLPLTSPAGLVNQAGRRPDLVFNDLLPTPQGELAATHRGLFWRSGAEEAWQPAAGASPAVAYVVARTGQRFYAGFEGTGLWQAPAAIGPWQPAALTATTILDLAVESDPGTDSLVERLYASSPTGLWRKAEPAGSWQTVPLPGLAPVELEQAGEIPADKFRPALWAGSDSHLLVRAQDRLWRQTEAGWESIGPEELAGRLLSSWGCCEAGALLGSNQAGLWQMAPAGEWQRLDGRHFERTDLTALAQVGGRLYAAGALGLFEFTEGQSWQKVAGLPSVITDLVIDPADPARWLAGTPAGLYRSRDRGRSWTAVSPPWTVWDLAWGPQDRLFVGRANGLAWTDRPGDESIPWQEADGMSRVAFLRVRPHSIDPQTVWSGTWGNNIGVSDDGGEEVEPLHNGLETLTGLDVLWLPRPGRVLLATGEGVYRSQDGGQSWARLPGPLSRQTVYALFHTPDGTLWAGAADGLWSSRDGGESWGAIPDLAGLTVLRVGQLTYPLPPPVIPYKRQPLVYGQPRWLWAGTEGGGVWVSRDNGVTWSPAGLPERTVYTLQLQDRLLAATDRGIWAATIPESLLAGK